LPAGGCRLTGTSCGSNADCCGGAPGAAGGVTCDTGRCDNGTSCNATGNICGAPVLPDGGKINASQNCCNDFSAGKDVCKLDSSGIPRCFGGASAQCPTGYTGEAPCCIAAGERCEFKDQCCGGAPCVPGADGGLVCTVASCKPLGTTCAATSECCAGSECLASSELTSVCQLPSTPQPGLDGGPVDAGPACKPNAAACTTGAECCSQLCTGGVCTVPQACQPQGSICTNTSDCCSGTSCVVTPGTPTGTCQAASCAGSGQPCVDAAGCCNGLACLDSNSNFCTGSTACTCNVIIN
jgi:hypothetical protein